MNKKRQEQIEKGEQRLFEKMGISFPYKRPKEQWQKSDPTKILVLSDPHEPYGHLKVHQESLREKDAETLIVAGDIGDYYSRSRFRKEKRVDFGYELASVFQRIEWYAAHWERVFLMLGNHDDRPQKQLLDSVDVDLAILTEQNLIEHFASYFDNVEVVGTQLSTDINLSHIYQHGDIIFTHGEISRAQESSLLERISQYLHEWKKVLRLKPYRVLCQAHNHRAGHIPRGTEDWYLLPTASDPYSLGLKYIFSSKLYGKPPQLGYTVLYQEGGITDTNRTRQWILR